MYLDGTYKQYVESKRYCLVLVQVQRATSLFRLRMIYNTEQVDHCE